MRLLIVRTGVEPEPVMARLKEAGMESAAVTVMHPNKVPEAAEKLQVIYANTPRKPVLVTSRQGVFHLSQATKARDMRLVTVGSATAEESRKLGFTAVEDAGADTRVPEEIRGTAKGLVEYLRLEAKADKEWVYPSAEEIRQDMGKLLAGQGIRVERIVAYRMEPATTMPQDIQNDWPHYKGVLFYSRNAAQHFVNLAMDAGLSISEMKAFCLSKEIASIVHNAGFFTVVSAKEPTGPALIDAVYRSR